MLSAEYEHVKYINQHNTEISSEKSIHTFWNYTYGTAHWFMEKVKPPSFFVGEFRIRVNLYLTKLTAWLFTGRVFIGEGKIQLCHTIRFIPIS